MEDSLLPVSLRHLSCWVCKQLFRNPATLPCGDSFCLQCIEECWAAEECCSCPQCGQSFASRPPLVRNTSLAEVVRDTKERMKRREQDPAEAQPKRPRISTEAGGEPLCEHHRLTLDSYCCTDQQIICALCALSHHAGHSFGLVSVERRRKQEKLKELQEQLQEALLQQKNQLDHMKLMSEQIEEQAKETTDCFEAVVVRVTAWLQERYETEKKLIEAQAKKAAAQLNKSLPKLQRRTEEMREMDAKLSKLAGKENDVEFLQNWPDLQKLFEEDHLQELAEGSEDLLLPFKDKQRVFEDLEKQLEELWDEKLATISQTHICEQKLLRNDNVEPSCREEFLQYACDLHLDSSTAHHDLVISKGEKKVKLLPANSASVLSSPHRFTRTCQVLCREALQAERCYYEVEVQGEKVEIALAYRSMDRKSPINSSFGGNSQSWSLDRSETYSVSHKNGSVRLTAAPRHQRIGVYLKFKEGKLTFYEINTENGDMEFLYTVESTFTEPLHPGFWLGVKSCIMICDLTDQNH